MDGHRHTRRRSSLPNAPVANAGKRRPEPIQVVHVPAPSLGAAMPTPPPSADSKLPTKEMAELDIGDRPPTPAPSPTPDRKRPDLTPEPDEQTNGSPTDALVEKGKARARDGELVGPDLRREGSFGDSDPKDLLLRFQRFDKSQRAAFLTALVNDLELNEALTVSRRIEPRLRRDFLKELPLELALHVMSFFDEARTLGRAAQVSRYWNHLFSDEQTWKEIYDRHRGMSHTGLVAPATSPFLVYGQQFRASRSGSVGPSGRADPDEIRARFAIPSLESGTPGFKNALGGRPFAERVSSGSFKQQFKNAYLAESNWLHGGHVLVNYIPPEDGPVTTLSMNERWVVVGMANSRIHVFDITTGRIKQHLLGHQGGVWALAIVSKNDMARSQFRRSSKTNGETRSASSMGLSTDGSNGRRSSFNSDRTANPGSARTEFGLLPGMGAVHSPRRPSTATGYGHARQPRETRKMPSSDVCGSSMGWPGLRRDLVVSGGSDRDLMVWDLETAELIHVLQGHTSTLRCMKMLDERPICVTGGRDGSVKVWDIDAGVLVHDLSGHTNAVRCLEVAGNQIVSGSYDHTCRLWDADTGECLHVLTGHFGPVYAVAFDGVRIVAGSADSTVRVWSAATGQCVALLQGHTSLVGQLQLTDDILTTGGSDGRIIVFNLETMMCLERLCAHDNSVTGLQFDQRFILSGGNDGRAKVWDMQTGRFLRELTIASESVWRVAFKEDRAVVLCQREGGMSSLEFISFRPEDQKVKSTRNPNVDRQR